MLNMKIAVISNPPAPVWYRLVLWITLSMAALNAGAQNAKQMTDSGFHKDDHHQDLS